MAIAQVKENSKTTQPISLSWIGSPSVQKLMDVIASIIAEDYIQIAKQNSDIFSDNGGKK